MFVSVGNFIQVSYVFNFYACADFLNLRDQERTASNSRVRMQQGRAVQGRAGLSAGVDAAHTDFPGKRLEGAPFFAGYRRKMMPAALLRYRNLRG
jgi:hypothetical protein